MGIGDVGQQPQRRPGQVEQHRAAEAKMRRAGFFGHHPPRDKEHHLASRKCRRESTPQHSQRGFRSGVLAASTPWLVRSDRPSSIVAPNRNITKTKSATAPPASPGGPSRSSSIAGIRAQAAVPETGRFSKKTFPMSKGLISLMFHALQVRQGPMEN
jgi:hypothetical protein